MRRQTAAVVFGLICIGQTAHGLVLRVPKVTQEQTNWCWAATSKAVFDYYQQFYSQCSIANYAREHSKEIDFGEWDCCDYPDYGCNQANYMYGEPGDIQDIFSAGDLESTGYSFGFDLRSCRREIESRRPFIIRWGWDDGGGHFIVAHGVHNQTLYYMDPWYGEGHMLADHDWVLSGGSHTWTHTLVLRTSPECECSQGQCCDGCFPLDDYTSCDDGDQETILDFCKSGACTGI